MNTNLERRLTKLEETRVPSNERVFITYGRSKAEHETQIETLKARGEARENDQFLCVTFVAPSNAGVRA
jgi:hypothetical protein